jgi:hypothetical protein
MTDDSHATQFLKYANISDFDLFWSPGQGMENLSTENEGFFGPLA